MILAGNQPYLLPYLGYWQLINLSDLFLLADDYDYIRHKWINRNRILLAGQPVNWLGMAMIPVGLFLMFIFCIGCSFLVSTVTVFVKDIGYLMSVVMRLVFWITPTFFLVSEAKGLLKAIVWYNPFTYYVEMFHDILYYGIFPHVEYLCMSIILAAVMFLIGAYVFFRYEKKFPEVL